MNNPIIIASIVATLLLSTNIAVSGQIEPGADQSQSQQANSQQHQSQQPPWQQTNKHGLTKSSRSGSYSPEQVAKVVAILSKYSPSSLTAAEAKAINNAFRHAGIRRGPGQPEAIKAAGFDPEKIRALDPPPPEQRPLLGHQRQIPASNSGIQ